MTRLAEHSSHSNPYSTFRFCCTSLRTKEHAQLIGIISLSVFVCLIVVSYSLFGAFAVVYIAVGVILYGFLVDSLLRKPNKIAILGYVTFEALQIAFYLSLAIYILIPLIYPRDFDWACENVKARDDKDYQQVKEDCATKAALVEILIFLIFLIVIKSYFTRVMLNLYKFYEWMERHSSDLRAAYINNRGVQINVDDNIFPPPPVWTPGLYSTTINPLPTYSEATSIHKPPAPETQPIDQNNVDNHRRLA